RGKDSYSYQHNYVDRVRLEDTATGHQQSNHDPRCPQLRAAGWRHAHKSVSHLDLATSCHEAAGAGLSRHQSHQHLPQQQSHHQHSLLHHSHSHSHPHHPHAQPHWTQCRVGVVGGGGPGAGSGNGQLRNARSLDYTQLEREENALDIAEFYWRFDAEAPLDQVDSYAVLSIKDNYEPSGGIPGGAVEASPPNGSKTNGVVPTTAKPSSAAPTLFDILGSESCSLRRSRSLAVIREETFSDLQIGSANSSRRRSQLIPRARLVSRGFFRESPSTCNFILIGKCETIAPLIRPSSRFESPTRRLNSKANQTTSAVGEQLSADQHLTDEVQSHRSNPATCDSHQQHLQQQQQQPQQRNSRESRDFDVYYDNLKRLDALALGLGEQLHPWHNDKSDLESLNSDYFKNSLHQNHLDQQQPSSLELEALEQVAVSLLKERPRIYQSRRQQQLHRSNHLHSNCLQRHLDTGGESCPEHSQSSVFPETTTSNSDDQTDTPSLSEQEYDLTHIEEIYHHDSQVEESYELISLTTTARTHFESSEEEEPEAGEETATEEAVATPSEPPTSDSDSTVRQPGSSDPLDKLIAYDSVYLSSEDSSDCTLIGESCESFEQRTFTSCGESGELETRSLLHISIEDTVYEPQAKQHKKSADKEEQTAPLLTSAKVEAQIFTQVLKVEHTPKPKILTVVEKRKLKQEEAKQQPPELKRQATDSFVIGNASKSNLTENQYHSLPDVNIGVSLKVCENIDKELRSSYNQQRQQQRKEAKRDPQQLQQQQKQQKQQVTRAETYDSIRRFGRAHQKARQREYKEREREREREALQEKEKEREKHREKPKINKEFPVQERQIEVKEASITEELIKEKQEVREPQEEEPLPPPPPPLTEEFLEQEDCPKNLPEEEEEEDTLSCVSISQPEQPKEAPAIEVANFSKLIERRAQEIRERQEQNSSKQTPPHSFHIIVTDTQNNIIQKEAIQEGQRKATANPQACNPTQRSLRRSASSSSGKPLEHRILSAGAPIYKARPVKVLATSTYGESSFSRGKMSRPQILHVVDGRSAAAGSGASGTMRRRSTAKSLASTISSSAGGGEVAHEYLQKVDAVRCYWNKLAGNEPETLKTETPAKENQPSFNFQVGGETSIGRDKAPPENIDFFSMMPPPSIEIVELGEGSRKATIVKAAEVNTDQDEDPGQFDHIRYKVLRSQQLIRTNILATRNKKEAQFDGLIQYLQEYSFQELLSNNNVVIVEPVRTKIERPMQVGTTPVSAIPPPKPPRAVNTSSATDQPRKTRQGQIGGAAAKRHFFYQPVRVNRELYEDELPHPDTVRNARRFFEQNMRPTQGQGLLLQSQQKFGGSAYQLSPKTRSARGYRYLTIDTSYGSEEQPKGMELLEEHKAKHWDNASLSSGISSGDLSSPCGEYQHQESPVLACKDVHVQDVVRRHNSNAANAKARAKLANRRTWCIGGAGTGAVAAANESLYRQIYENNLGQAEQQDNGDHLQQEDNEQVGQYEDEVEQDMCDNYYVSNDVLAKIRECGSTVTYYGGRVVDATTAVENPMPQPTKATHPQAVTGARSRIRQIEACNVCLPSDRCEHQLQTKQTELADQDSYQAGIKFKLVKSNSCSSRLELAGTGGDEVTPDSVVVRKMVHHFEANQAIASYEPQQLTINSQSPIMSEKVPEEEMPRRRVTVNNHINVLGDMTQELEKAENFNGQQQHQQHQQQPDNGYVEEDVLSLSPTYESQAMNIRLDGVPEKNKNQQSSAIAVVAAVAAPANVINKVRRNKNVDLAYTLVKTNPPKGKTIEFPSQKIGKQQPEQGAVEKTEMPSAQSRPQIIVPVEIHPQVSSNQQQPQTPPVTAAAPVPPLPERRLSNASSSNSIVDKTVVRYYVANDRSIYERRKYDEIEFEEFEVYDPSKEGPPEEVQPAEKTDAELYDSLDDKV
ncbi:hypothetical protein KR018_010022, partial [Drosophila ironensis]